MIASKRKFKAQKGFIEIFNKEVIPLNVKMKYQYYISQAFMCGKKVLLVNLIELSETAEEAFQKEVD